MSDYMTFISRIAASAELAKLRGWNARMRQLYLPGNPHANRNGNAFVIECRAGNSDAKYLRTDGQVR